MSEQSQVMGIAKVPTKFKEVAPTAVSGITLATVLWAVSLQYQNFSKLQDQLTESASKTVVLEQQVGSLKDKVSDLSNELATQAQARVEVQNLETQLEVLKSTTDLRISKLEGGAQ